jgi:antitoxin VapB
MRKEGDCLIISPAGQRSLLQVLASLQPLEEEFPAIEDRPPGPVDL